MTSQASLGEKLKFSQNACPVYFFPLKAEENKNKIKISEKYQAGPNKKFTHKDTHSVTYHFPFNPSQTNMEKIDVYYYYCQCINSQTPKVEKKKTSTEPEIY